MTNPGPKIDPNEYEPRPGDRWEKYGPIGAVTIKRVVLPGYEYYDGGLPGLSVRYGYMDGAETVFLPGVTAKLIARRMQESGRRLMARGARDTKRVQSR